MRPGGRGGKFELSATSIETLRHMVVAGIGVTLIPELARQENDSMRYIPFAGETPSRRIGLAWRNTSTQELLPGPLATLIRRAVGKPWRRIGPCCWKAWRPRERGPR